MTDDEPGRKSIMAAYEVWQEFEDRRDGTGLSQSDMLAKLLDNAEFHETPTADEVREIIREELRRVLPDELVAPPR